MKQNESKVIFVCVFVFCFCFFVRLTASDTDAHRDLRRLIVALLRAGIR